MIEKSLITRWRDAFMEVVAEPDHASPLKEAALTSKLAPWTKQLTRTVVVSCLRLGWAATAKGYPSQLHSESRNEYLNIDVMAFALRDVPWQFPLAAFELENSPQDSKVAYSLWKVLCLRVPFRVVFAYRHDWEESRELVEMLTQDVIGSFALADMANLSGETIVIVGNRGEGETFPWGYFKFWQLDANVGRFEKV
jgi:hypothetical protein